VCYTALILDQFTIYRQHADQYERLVSYEDYEQRLWPALSAIRSFAGADVVEWGAGTGRVTALIASAAGSIMACDLNDHMLKVARLKLARLEQLVWQTAVADHRHMPLPDHCADVSLAGWTLSYFNAQTYGDGWRDAIGCSIEQMQRVLRPGGTIIIIETLGTGFTAPKPPTEALAACYRALEEELGFQSTWIRTDYKFDSLDRAVSLISFFFGGEWVDKVRDNNWIVLPECTGIWWKEVP
jgi:ubiquinone/menaquinone biosynthesis C-methylase UbiE